MLSRFIVEYVSVLICPLAEWKGYIMRLGHVGVFSWFWDRKMIAKVALIALLGVSGRVWRFWCILV